MRSRFHWLSVVFALSAFDSPLLLRVVLHRADGDLRIEARPGRSVRGVPKRMLLDGEVVAGPYLEHAQLAGEHTLMFEMGEQAGGAPNRAARTALHERPNVDGLRRFATIAYGYPSSDDGQFERMRTGLRGGGGHRFLRSRGHLVSGHKPLICIFLFIVSADMFDVRNNLHLDTGKGGPAFSRPGVQRSADLAGLVGSTGSYTTPGGFRLKGHNQWGITIFRVRGSPWTTEQHPG